MKFAMRKSPRGYAGVDTPLYDRVPRSGSDGRALGDFMMLLPGLRDASPARLREKAAAIEAVLCRFPGVVFAELNVPLNLLWVSLVPEFGLSVRVAATIRERVPEALLIAPER